MTAAGILSAVASLEAGTAAAAAAAAVVVVGTVAVAAEVAAAGSVPPGSVLEEQAVAQPAEFRSAAAAMEPRQMCWVVERSFGVPTKAVVEGEGQGKNSGPPLEELRDVVLLAEDPSAVGSAEQRNSGWPQWLVVAEGKGEPLACQ